MVYTHPMTRIGIDCRLSGAQHAGIGRYIEELTLRLPDLNTNITWVYFFYSKDQADNFLRKFSSKKGKKNQPEIIIAPIKHYSLQEQLKMPSFFARQNLDILHVPHFNIPIFYKGKIVVTIHDLLWHEFRGLQATTLNPASYMIKYLAYRKITAKALKKAKKIIVPAKTIKQTVSKYYPKVKNKIAVTYEGAGQFFSQPKTLPATENTLVYVGSLYPHKNIKVVIRALKDLPDFTLKLVGSRNIFQQQTREIVKKYEASDQVEFTGYLTDDKLAELLHSAFALIQPSLSEGFGLTGVEAMASGVPVIASDIPIFKEIYKDAAVYFNPHRHQSFALAVEKLSGANRESLISKGLKVSSAYSWDKMTQQTLDIYTDVLNIN